MGHRTTQRILQCSQCKETPEDGDYLWEMCGEYLCEDCVEAESPSTKEQEHE